MNPFLPLLILLGLFGVVILIALVRSIRIVPAQTALVIERLGRYVKTLDAGFHVLIPFIDKVAFKHSKKEQAINVPAQACFTWDNVKVEVDGVLYMKIVDPQKASYGTTDAKYATIQLAQTTMRSVVGQLELDKTFEERSQINAKVVQAVDEASDPWGVKVSRYEIQNINMSPNILEAMEVQMRAEREKRAEIAKSEGTMESHINSSQAAKEEAINTSEGEKQRYINEAEGQAQEILSMARATAEGIRKVAEAISQEGGEDAAALQISEQYIEQLKHLQRDATRLVLPLDLSNVNGVLSGIRRTLRGE
jgi:regulator of protease activity HflC (stomatin/prohibitin superfamily)